MDEKLKRKYFIDHSSRTTSWNDPRPPITLPIPRPAVSPAVEGAGASAGAPAISGVEGAESSRIRTNYDGSHKQDLDWYRDVLQMSLIDKSLTPDEDALLASVRQKLKISQDDHRTILKECGWTHEEFEGIRKEDPWRRECCQRHTHTHTQEHARTPTQGERPRKTRGDLPRHTSPSVRLAFFSHVCPFLFLASRARVGLCLDAPATYIILDCFHLCLCEKCSLTLASQEVSAGKEKLCPKCRSVIRVIHKTY